MIKLKVTLCGSFFSGTVRENLLEKILLRSPLLHMARRIFLWLNVFRKKSLSGLKGLKFHDDLK